MLVLWKIGDLIFLKTSARELSEKPETYYEKKANVLVMPKLLGK